MVTLTDLTWDSIPLSWEPLHRPYYVLGCPVLRGGESFVQGQTAECAGAGLQLWSLALEAQRNTCFLVTWSSPSTWFSGAALSRKNRTSLGEAFSMNGSVTRHSISSRPTQQGKPGHVANQRPLLQLGKAPSLPWGMGFLLPQICSPPTLSLLFLSSPLFF